MAKMAVNRVMGEAPTRIYELTRWGASTCYFLPASIVPDDDYARGDIAPLGGLAPGEFYTVSGYTVSRCSYCGLERNEDGMGKCRNCGA